MLGANVLHLADDGRRVISSVAIAGRVETIVSGVAIVTAPAPIARAVVGAMTPPARAFLESVEFGAVTACVLGLRGPHDLTPFSYVATPDLPMRAVFSPRVILAGDYTFPEFPYGMRAAAKSGARAAGEALKLIRG